MRDHASNRVPDDIDLGVAPALLNQHIAVDIGVAAVGALLAERPGIAAFQANISRLVCDLNRDEHSPAIVPISSDGHVIPGNRLGKAEREARIERFYRPYHSALGDLINSAPPALILSIHSFTPSLMSHPDAQRPWQVGVLYNTDGRGARLAMPLLEGDGLIVGDQEPYSGTILRRFGLSGWRGSRMRWRCDWGKEANAANTPPVILNSFQDPSCLGHGSLHRRLTAPLRLPKFSALEEKWILKRVQDDSGGLGGIPTLRADYTAPLTPFSASIDPVRALRSHLPYIICNTHTPGAAPCPPIVPALRPMAAIWLARAGCGAPPG
jgi:hypothetical protein